MEHALLFDFPQFTSWEHIRNKLVFSISRSLPRGNIFGKKRFVQGILDALLENRLESLLENVLNII